MDSQTKVGRNGRAGPNKSGTAQASTMSLLHNAIELGELQVRLLAADLAAAFKATRFGSLMLLVGAAVLLAALPLILEAVAIEIETWLEISRTASLLLTGVVVSLLSLGLIAAGWRSVRRGADKLSRSREEFLNNVNWAKQMLSQEGESDASHHRHYPTGE